MLWQLEHPDFSETSFLFGTMHVQDIRAFGKWELVKAKILECDAFAVEFDLEDKGQAASYTSTQIPEGQQLVDLIPEKKYKKLRRTLLKATGFDLDRAQHTLPFLLIGIVSSFILRKDIPTSLDEQLWAFAKSESKELLGIETLEEQLSVLAKIPLENQVEMLLSLGKNIGRTRKELIHLTELYQKEELQLLNKAVRKQAGGLRKIMIYRRNEIMAERIYEQASSKKIFVAIGAGHLGGGKGVLRLLKQKGMKLRPVRV